MTSTERFKWGLQVGLRDAIAGINSWGLVIMGDYIASNPFRNWAPCSDPYDGWNLAVKNHLQDKNEKKYGDDKN